MPAYELPWKSKEALFKEFHDREVAPLEDKKIYAAREKKWDDDTRWLSTQDWDDEAEYIRSNLKLRFMVAARQVENDLKARIAQSGLRSSDLEQMNALISHACDDSWEQTKGEQIGLTDPGSEERGNQYFLFLQTWATKLHNDFGLEATDLKQESTVSIKPFFKNLALSLTGVGFFVFLYSSYKKYDTGHYAFFDDQVIPEKLRELTTGKEQFGVQLKPGIILTFAQFKKNQAAVERAQAAERTPEKPHQTDLSITVGAAGNPRKKTVATSSDALHPDSPGFER